MIPSTPAEHRALAKAFTLRGQQQQRRCLACFEGLIENRSWNTASIPRSRRVLVGVRHATNPGCSTSDADTIMFRIWGLTEPVVSKGWPSLRNWPIRELVLPSELTLSTMSLALWQSDPGSSLRPLKIGSYGLNDQQKATLDWVCSPNLRFEIDRARHRFGLARPLPINVFHPLTRALQAAVDQIRGYMDDLHDADGAIPARLLQAEDGQYELLIREFQPLPFAEGTRIVMLDGTADLALSRKIICRDDLEILKVNIPLYPGSEIIQITEPRLPRSSASLHHQERLRVGADWRSKADAT